MLNKLNRYKYSRADVKAALKGQRVPFLAAFPGVFKRSGSKLIAVVDGRKLEVVPNEDRDKLLRKAIYTPGSAFPFGRDSLFSLLKEKFLNVSKRDIETFLKKQKVLVTRRSRPPEEKRISVRLTRTPGVISSDLVHVRAKDFKKLLGKKPGLGFMPGAGEHDRYFLNSVETHTGYLLSDILYGKKVEYVLAPLTKQLERFKQLLGRKVARVEFDKGKEFMGDVTKMLNDKKIRFLRKITNASVESKNAHMQRNFWAVVEQKRTGFAASLKEAVAITNNTLNRTTGLTPLRAMTLVRQGKKVPYKRRAPAPAKLKKTYDLQTWVRGLKKKRGKHTVGFKRYKGDTFGPVLRITAIRHYGPYPKYKVGDRWFFHDQIIKLGEPTEPKPQDLEADRIVALRRVTKSK